METVIMFGPKIQKITFVPLLRSLPRRVHPFSGILMAKLAHFIDV
jgi:hypothetical protein